ncbi:MAG TPA: OPT/YSL family transporter [Burkholderiales bacterium]|nr:OPT/YSL family transporter [Burkholderiales bacterium]
MATERELSPRALATGLVLGAALTPCNVYSGLKIGWSFNMSIAALLAGLAFWRAAERAARAAPWTIKESNICQTAASAAASIISGGLVAPIPAYTLITGRAFDPWPLAAGLLERRAPSLAARFTVAAAAGLVAGESLVGVAQSLAGMVRG